jgi:sulfopyruvate decarboxylase TPP-binding subunit
MPATRIRPDQLSPESKGFANLLVELGVTHLVALPDNTSAPLLDAVQFHEGIRLLLGTREGEVIALASGLWLGGAAPAVLIQNTGLLEAGDGLRGTASRMGAPILLLVTCRGYAKYRSAGLEPREVKVTRDVLVQPNLDSVAPMTEPTLEAWGIPFVHLRDAGDLTPVREAWAQANREERPVAVLVDTSFT